MGKSMSKGKKKVGEVLPGPRKLRLADVVAIPLFKNTYAYARVYQDARLGIYDIVTKGLASIDDLKGKRPLFYVGYYEPLNDHIWIFMGRLPFENEEEAWSAPPVYDRDVIDPSIVRIYHRGEQHDATEAEIKGLDSGELLPPIEIRDLILERLKV